MPKYKFVAFVLGFVAGSFWFLSETIWPSFRLIEVNPPIGSEIDQQIASDLPNMNAILEIHVPAPSDSDEQWRFFFDRLSNIRNATSDDSVYSRSPILSFIVHFAEQKPGLFMELVEQGKIHINTFNGLLQRGILLDWERYSQDPHLILRSSQMALLRLANRIGIAEAQERAKLAFLGVSEDRKEQLAIRNLSFTAPAMNQFELRQVWKFLHRDNVGFNTQELELLEEHYPEQELIALIRLKSVDAMQGMRHEVAAYLLGDLQYGDSMLLAKAEKDVFVQRGLRADYPDYKPQGNRKQYCVMCALALGHEGQVGQPLLESAIVQAAKRPKVSVEGEQLNKEKMIMDGGGKP